MLEYLQQKFSRVLDVGCSNGAFGESIKKQFPAEVWGVDINPAAIQAAQAKLDRALCFDLSLNLNSLENRYFDVIYFNDVLEHFVDPYSLLKGVKDKLTDSGQVIASIPNVRFFRVLSELLFKKDFRYQEDGVLDKTHLRFFTETSIKRMFLESGYRVTKLEPINKTKSSRAWFMYLFTLGLIGRDIFYPQFAVIAVKN
jgi:2-polyprenyl-3-methyl-5-hydroxy-6-metoxy-1,4-benzoquinol methylase